MAEQSSTAMAHQPCGACPHSTIGEEFNPFFGEQLRDPYPFYARARREEPVFYSSILKLWYVTRYDDIVAVLKDPERFSSADAVNVPLDYTPRTRHAIHASFLSQSSLTNNDPPSHTVVRRVISKAFTRRQVESLEPRVRAIADDLLDRFASHGHVEFVREFSFPLPMRVILAVMGVPESDMLQLKQWADDWIALVTRPLTPEEQDQVIDRLLESQKYWEDLISSRKTDPRDDLLTDLIAASEDGEGPISLYQMINACSVIVLAGHETTMNLIGNCLYHLLTTPEQWRLVCEDRANIPRAVEETLRADTSVPAMMRTATEPVTLGGVELPRGSRLALLFASGNHDESAFPNSEQFDLKREDSQNHLSFGRGIHFCIGAPLARLEARIALELLIARLPGLRLAPGHDQEYIVSPVHRGHQQLHLEWNV
jgi:cytochrome P450